MEAVAAAVAHRPDVIALDVMMPVVDGFEALKRLKQTDATRDIPVLMLTAVSEKKEVMNSLVDGASDYVIKGSVGIKNVCARLENLIQSSKSQTGGHPGHGPVEPEYRLVSDPKLQQTVEELSRPPAGVARVLSIANAPDCTARHWAQFLEKDNGLAQTMAALADVHLPEDSNRDREITRKLVSLGTRRLQYMAVSAAMLSWLSQYSSPALQRHLLRTAVLARCVAVDVLGGNSDEALAAGLLHDFGKILLRNSFPSQYDSVLERAGQEKTPAIELERSILGTDHAAFAGTLLKAWGLPAELADAVRLHHNTWREITEEASFNPSLVAAVQVADALDRTWNLATDEDDRIQHYAEAACRALDAKQRCLKAALDRAAAHLKRVESLLPGKTLRKTDLPKWAAGFAWKKALLVQNSDSGTLLLGTFLDRCEVVVERASFQEALEKMETCELVFICLSEEAEIEEAANTAEKIAASEKPLPVCVLLMAPVDAGDKFSGLNVLESPLSLKSLAETFREITPPAAVEDAHPVET